MTDPTNPGPPEPPGVPPAYPTAPPTGQWTPPPPGGEVPTVPLTGAPDGGGGGGARKVLVGAVALLVLGGGAYASTQLLGGDDRGAGSPEEAAEQLIEALNGSDVLGAIDLLPDGERDVLLSVADLAGEAERLGFLDEEDFSLDGFNGVTIQIEDPEFEVEELGEGLSRVSLVAGTATVEVDGDDVLTNIGDLGDELADDNDADLDADDFDDEFDIEEIVDEARDEAEDFDEEFTNPFSIAVIEDDGRFFPSIGFTVAEFARADANRFGDEIDAPDLGDGIEPEGGDSPLEAVQALAEAATSLDAEAALAVLDPGEVGAAQVYVPLLGELPGSEDSGVEVEINDAEVSDIGRGANRVVLTDVTASGEFDGTEFDFTLADGCVELTVEGEEDFELERTCFDEDIESDLVDDLDVPEEISDLIAAFLPIEGGIVTVERDGQHFVSPLRTVVQGIAGVVDDIDREDLEEGGIIRDAIDGELGDEFEDFGDSFNEVIEDADPEDVPIALLAFLQDQEVDIEELLSSAPGIGTVGSVGFGIALAAAFSDFEDFEDFEIDEPIIEDDFDDDFEDEFEDDVDDETTTTFPIEEEDEVRTPTGPTGTGPNGELLVGEVVAGTVDVDGVTTFTAIGAAGSADGVLIGAQATDGSDLTITVIDQATGTEIDFDDDFNFPDPEVLVFLEEGQVVTIEVREFGGDAGSFVVYYEQF